MFDAETQIVKVNDCIPITMLFSVSEGKRSRSVSRKLTRPSPILRKAISQAPSDIKNS